MKQIESYNANKYNSAMYSEIEDGIYEAKVDGESLYVTSLSFIQEPGISGALLYKIVNLGMFCLKMQRV
ncbi:MAG: hypothetical protein ACRC36_17460 [Lacrimispora sphenoides]